MNRLWKLLIFDSFSCLSFSHQTLKNNLTAKIFQNQHLTHINSLFFITQSLLLLRFGVSLPAIILAFGLLPFFGLAWNNSPSKLEHQRILPIEHLVRVLLNELIRVVLLHKVYYHRHWVVLTRFKRLAVLPLKKCLYIYDLFALGQFL